MKNVNIYLSTSLRRPVRQDGKWIFILEAASIKGKPTLTDGEAMQGTTENGLALTALLHAMERIREPCYIEIYTDCAHLAAALQNGWVTQWEQNGWKNKKGQPVKDVEKWSRLQYLLAQHTILVHLKKEHEYKEWMDTFVTEKEDIKKSIANLAQTLCRGE